MDEVIGRLRRRGHVVSDVYVQAEPSASGASFRVVIDGVAMPFWMAKALDRGVTTLSEIATYLSNR